MSKSESQKLRKNAAQLVPFIDEPEDFLKRGFYILAKVDEHSDLEYFRKYLSKHNVKYEDKGDKLIVAIYNCYENKEASARLRKEGTGRQGNRFRNISVLRYLPLLEAEDKAIIIGQATKTTVNELRWIPREIYADGGCYVIFDEQEKECLYVGQTKGDPAARADEHFLRKNEGKTPFDKYCKEQFPDARSWLVYLVQVHQCDFLIRKSFFWNIEEYNMYQHLIEEKYKSYINNRPGWLLNIAELALISLFEPKYNINGHAENMIESYGKGRSGNRAIVGKNPEL